MTCIKKKKKRTCSEYKLIVLIFCATYYRQELMNPYFMCFWFLLFSGFNGQIELSIRGGLMWKKSIDVQTDEEDKSTHAGL